MRYTVSDPSFSAQNVVFTFVLPPPSHDPVVAAAEDEGDHSGSEAGSDTGDSSDEEGSFVNEDEGPRVIRPMPRRLHRSGPMTS